MSRATSQAGFAVLMLAAAAAAEELPFEVDLPLATVEIEIDNARIDITYEIDAQPILSASAASGEGEESSHLDLRGNAAAVRLARPIGVQSSQPIVVEAVLDVGQELSVIGRNLDIVVGGALTTEMVDSVSRVKKHDSTDVAGDPAAPAPPPAPLRLQIENSSVVAHGVFSPTVIARDSDIELGESFGPATVELEGGTVTMAGHHGASSFRLVDSTSTMSELQGTVNLHIEDGTMALRGGRGAITANSSRALVQVGEWRGTAKITTDEGSFSCRGSSFNKLELFGIQAELAIEDTRVNLAVRIHGGSLRLAAARGVLKIEADFEAEVEIDGYEGGGKLTIRGESSARLDGVAGTPTLTVSDSTLEVSGITGLDLQATGADLTIDGVERIDRCQVDRSSLRLDLGELHNLKPQLEIRSGTTAVVELDTPCRVQLVGPGAGLSHHVTVSGCELRLQNTGNWTTGGLRSMDGRFPVTLTAHVAENAELTVNGR